MRPVMLVLAIAGASAAAPPYFDDLGDYHYPVTTDADEAQRYFDQGLRLLYAFNHDEALRSFRWALEVDPECAMCAWGAAYVLGPNINMPAMPERLEQAAVYAEQALRLAGATSEKEQALIEALGERYAAPYTVDAQLQRDVAYADAMREVALAYSDDADVQTLFAESLMDLRPWDYWTVDGQPRPGTLELVDTLEDTLARWPDHPGANHYYIHAVEASPLRDRAVDAAERLGDMMPGAGHLVHMPGHIWLGIGDYEAAAEANRQAIEADLDYYDRGGLSDAYAMYTAHNYLFLSQAAMYLGRADESISAARGAAAAMPSEVLEMVPGWDSSLSTPVLMLARFGYWDDVLAEPAPPQQFPFATAMWHYARGLAYVGLGDTEAAAQELDALDTIRQGIAEDAPQGRNTSRGLSDIAGDVLEGEIAAAEGDIATAVDLLTDAAAAEDQLRYNEPSDQPWPVRHQLGEILLEAGLPAEAEAVWREDLVAHPENGWALRGLAESLRAQGKGDEAAGVEERLGEAWATADVAVTESDQGPVDGP